MSVFDHPLFPLLTGSAGGAVGRAVAFPFDTARTRLAVDKTLTLHQMFVVEGLRRQLSGVEVSAATCAIQKG